jgi:hypothetical protein
MKRGELIRKISKRSKAVGKTWELTRQGANHEQWTCGTSIVYVPRHSQVNDLTAQGICKDLEDELGEGWWR